MENSKRLDFLDSLRTFTISLVILLHTAIAYLSPSFGGWVHEKETQSLLIGLIMLVFDSPVLMPILFFIAGYFTLPSYNKKGTRGFLKDKLIRIGIPFLFGVLLISPTLACISVFSDGIKMGFIPCFLGFFNPLYFGHYHFWFLNVLIYFFLFTALILTVFKKKISSSGTKTGNFSFKLFLFFIGLCTLMHSAVGLLTGPFYNWVRLYIIVLQPSALPLYIAYFILGIYAFKNNWFKDGYKPKILPWAITYAVSMLLYLFIYMIVFAINPVTPIQKLLVSLVFNIAVFSWSFMLLGIFQKFVKNGSTFIKDISHNSFSTYIFHMYPLFLVLYMTRGLPIPYELRFLIQTILSIFLAWTLGYIMRKLPIFKKVL